MEIAELLKVTVDRDASDLHIAVGRPPVVRIDGRIIDLDAPPLTATESRRLVYSLLTDSQKQRFEADKELDFSLTVPNSSRFRVNVHYQRGSVAAAFRTVNSKASSFHDLGLPTEVLERMAKRPSGMILVTGPTGSGKSTTLAAMVDLINSARECHIITVEDPIEYIHPHKKALVEQREVTEDTHTFANALKYALRQDPDVILVGEMRDLETAGAAISAAETGHLVMSTLHTIDVAQTVDRIIDMFPPHQRDQIRQQFSAVIEGVVCQRLVPSARGFGREVACEILVGVDSVRNLIREGKTHQVYTQIEAGRQLGMQTMDWCLIDLCRRGRITRENALRGARKPEEVQRQLQRGGGQEF